MNARLDALTVDQLREIVRRLAREMFITETGEYDIDKEVSGADLVENTTWTLQEFGLAEG